MRAVSTCPSPALPLFRACKHRPQLVAMAYNRLCGLPSSEMTDPTQKTTRAHGLWGKRVWLRRNLARMCDCGREEQRMPHKTNTTQGETC